MSFGYRAVAMRATAVAAVLTALGAPVLADEITFVSGATGNAIENFKAYVKPWEDKTGNTVTIVPMPSSTTDQFGQYRLWLAAGNADVDVYQTDVIWAPQLAQHFVDLTEAGKDIAAMNFPAIIQSQTVNGKLVLRVTHVDASRIETRVEVGGSISNNKGVNVPDVVVPLPALTPKDRADLAFALEQGVDWIALSFVQRPEDVAEARALIGGKAALLAKIEKPQAMERLEEILELADAVMVARGDLGVELPPEQVPPAQKRIVEAARAAGKPVVVATQMLESMIVSPSPTRAEVSDVATAIYDGADAVMLSAESAAGAFPVEAVTMMDAIARQVEDDPSYFARVHFTETLTSPTTADALSAAAAQIARTIGARAIACFTISGSTARRAARERAAVPVLCLTPKLATARRMGLVWGIHAVQTRDVKDFEEMVEKSKRMALRTQLANGGDSLVLIAGVPFSTPGTTNVLHVVRLTGEELTGY